MNTIGINTRSSLDEIAAALYKAGVGSSGKSASREWPWGISDLDFKCYVLTEINITQDILTLCDDLDADAVSSSGHSLDRCTKAQEIRGFLSSPDPWTSLGPRDTAWRRDICTKARRVSCACHESGSFARRAPFGT